MMWLLFLIVLLHSDIVLPSFSPDTSDYDAYGLKVVANDVLFVQAKGSGKTFLIQFAPYNYTMDSFQCSINYDDTSHYVYSVGVGMKQNSSTNAYFYFAGEVVPQGSSDTDFSGRNGTFIGVWANRDPKNVQDYATNRQPLSCDHFHAEQLQFLISYGHQEFFVIAVEPYGKYAIGLATDFVFIYQPYPVSMITINSSSVVWPNNSTFKPCAADASETFTIVAGFVAGTARSRVRATPTVYLIWNKNLTVLSTWSYNATSSSWQSSLTYSGIDSWNSRYTMSVKINSDDPTRVLVGMPFLNTVFHFVISNSGTTLTLANYIDNGQSVGFGKSVTWLTTSQAAILVSTYSLDYLTWYSSKIYLYTALNTTTLPRSPSAVIPNSQQPLPSTINSKLIRITSTPTSLAILDTDGGVMLILSEQPGYYASTDTTYSLVAAAMPVISHSATCIGGTYKSDTGIHPCIICPSGRRNPGVAAGISCINCSSSSFCPLGAVYEMDTTSLTSLSQAYAYPRSPETDVYEDILLHSMLSLGSTGRCILVSPIFWTLILLIIFLLLLLGMASMNYCVQPEKREQWRTMIKSAFQRTDLVGEGELWIGGLASIGIVLITAMAYAFALTYLNQYPSEKVGPSSFACDPTLRNAKFQSSLQALAVPVSDVEQTIFDLLNEQNFTLQLDFLNTNALCIKLLIYEMVESSLVTLTQLSCSNTSGILSARVFLPQHVIQVKAILNDIQLVGGIRLGLSGSGQQDGLYSLQDLNFIQSFNSSFQTFAQKVTVTMTMTKVVNETEPLSGSDSEFGGIWYPTFAYSLSQMFITADSYAMYANQTSIALIVDISETSYYIKNVQSPIAKQPEVIFRTLLFAFLCLEICTMTFLISKLMLIPLFLRLYAVYSGRPVRQIQPENHQKSNAH